MSIVNIKGTSLIRDLNTMAVLSSNKNELEQYKLRKKIFAEQKNEINNIKQEVNQIRTDISDIKEMLSQIIQR
jgi:HAMP domain-containing protein